MWPVPNLKAFLLGSWKLERNLVDHDRATTGRLVGAASFSPCGRGLLYEERGTLTFGAHRGQAEQTYIYEFIEDDARASVRFRDGRAFHQLDLSGGRDHVCHACGADLYDGAFTALSASAWQSDWKVTGPRKNYELATTYTR
jgi:hypothetical protein